MNRTVRQMTDEYRAAALDLIYEAFTDWRDDTEGRLVRRLVEEIRSKRFYLPELEIICTAGDGLLIGYCMFSRFHLNGNFGDELLMLTPVCVRPGFQRQHISRDMIEYGLARAREMGFTACIVEGNPDNYRSRGFVTAADHGILPGKSVHLPHIDCLMAAEIVPGAFETIRGTVEYDCYETLTEE